MKNIEEAPQNLAAVDDLVRQAEVQMCRIVPVGCRALTSGQNRLRCPYWDNLHAVCDRVVGWSQALFTNEKRNLYLYGKLLPMGCDGDDVKLEILELGRCYAAVYSALESAEHQGVSGCRFPVVRVAALIRDIDKHRFAYGGQEPRFNIPSRGGFRQVTVDGYLDYMATQPVLFIENSGHGVTLGRVRDVLERLIRPRSQMRLTTFFSFDHSIQEVEGHFGVGLIRQMVASGCDPVDVRAAA